LKLGLSAVTISASDDVPFIAPDNRVEATFEIGKHRFVQWAGNQIPLLPTLKRAKQGHSANVVRVGPRPKVRATAIKVIIYVVVPFLQCLAFENLIAPVFDFDRPDVVAVKVFSHVDARLSGICKTLSFCHGP
jgi:hypothetical protein